MNTIINEETILVAVEFDYKNIFKSMFQHAKWMPEQKMWEIANSKRNNKRLIEFNKKVEDIKEFDMERKLQAELEETERAIEKNKKEEQAAIERTSKIQQLKAELANKKEELQKAEAAKEEALTKEAEEEVVIKEFIQSNLNMKAIIQKVDQIKKTWNSYSARKNDITILQKELKELYHPLEVLGYCIPALQDVYVANFNKREKDNVNKYTNDMFYKMEKIEEE